MALDIIKFIKGIRIKNEADTSKELELAVSASATTGTKTTLVAAQTADITITLPFASTTVVGEDTVNTLTNKTIDADDNTITNIDNDEIRAGAAIDATKIADGSVDNTEFESLDGVTSNIQDQLDAIAGSAITALTGDVTATGPGSVAATLATVNSDVGTYGTATDVAQVTVNAKGLVTAVTDVAIAIPASAITTTIPIAQGGTGQTTQTAAFDALAPTTTKADLIAHNGTDNIRLPVGTDGQILVADSSQASGLAYKYISGVKNYVTNGDAESSTTTGWTRVANTTPSARPEVTPGGTPDLVNFVFGNGTPGLRGTYCFTLSNNAGASRQGEQVRYDFTIDTADKAKVLNISFDYRISSGGTYGEGVGLADSDIIVYIVDRTNGILIEPSQYKLTGYAISQQERNYSATFQTTSNSLLYSLVLYKATAATAGFNINLDTVVIGPSAQPIEVSVVAATGVNASSTITGSASDVANWTELFDYCTGFDPATGIFTCPESGVYSIEGSLFLQATYAVDSFFNVDLLQNGNPAGSFQERTAGAQTYCSVNFAKNIVCQAGDVLKIQAYSSATSIIGLLSGYNHISFSKIAGLNSASDGKIIAASIGLAASQSIPNNTITTATFDTVSFDKTSSYNVGSAIYTVPEAGIYEVDTLIGFAASASGPRSVYIGKNANSVALLLEATFDPGAAATAYVHGKGAIECIAGDQLYISVYQNSGGALNIGGDATGNYVNIKKLSGSGSLVSNISVVFDTNSGAPTASISGASSLITFTNTPNIDSTASYNTASGLFTVPVSGTYKINGGIGISATYSVGQSTSVSIAKNGSVFRTGYSISGGSLSQDFTQVTAMVRCVAGDTLSLQAASDGTTPTINANGAVNFLSIERIGN